MPGRREWLRVTCGLQGGRREKDLYGPITRGTGEIGLGVQAPPPIVFVRSLQILRRSAWRRVVVKCKGPLLGRG